LSTQKTETAKTLIEAISAVSLAAAWVVMNDDVWVKFEKWVEDFTTMPPLPEEAQTAMDSAIAIVDEARRSIAIQNGLDQGLVYPRRFGDHNENLPGWPDARN
jgi:hypothetical protein